MAAKKPDKEVKTPKEVAPVVEKEEVVELDTKEIEKEVTEAAVESAKKKLAEELVGKPDDKKWKPKDYEEIRDSAVDKAKKEIKKEISADEKVKAKEEAKRLDEYNKYWAAQVKTLTEEGHLPKPGEEVQKKLDDSQSLTEEDKKDAGIVARQELYKVARENKESNLRLVYFEHMSGKKKTPAGATAPVFGSQKSVSTPSKSEWTYEEIHKPTIPEMVQEVRGE